MSGELVRLGGSNAQREVLEDTFIAALIGYGDTRAAPDLLETRLGCRAAVSSACESR
jgi:hypothetical protein